MITFEGKTALVTGASAGIGREFALQLHSKGARIIGVARRGDLLDELAVELNQKRPDSARMIEVDLTRRDDSAQSLDSLIQVVRSEQIDILVNNAGFGSFGFFEDLDIEREDQMVALNIEATMRLAHAVIPQMKERRSGAIVSVSSIAGAQPLPFMSTYAATKAFNYFHSLGLRYELAPFGVRVLTVCPGPVDTEFGGVARVPGTVTGSSRDPADAVVCESIEALQRNKAVVVPTLKAKVMWCISVLLPKTWSTVIIGRVLSNVLRKSKA